MFRKKKAYVTRVEKGHSHAILKNYMANKLAVVAAAVLIPVGCETLQLLFGRSFDVDDLICNFIGIVIGAAVAFAIRKVQPAGEERG